MQYQQWCCFNIEFEYFSTIAEHFLHFELFILHLFNTKIQCSRKITNHSNKNYKFQLHSSKFSVHFSFVLCVKLIPNKNYFWRMEIGIFFYYHYMKTITRATASKSQSNWMVTRRRREKKTNMSKKDHTKNDQLVLNGQFKSDATKDTFSLAFSIVFLYVIISFFVFTCKIMFISSKFHVTNIKLESKLNSIVQFGSVNCEFFFSNHLIKIPMKIHWNIYDCIFWCQRAKIWLLWEITAAENKKVKIFNSISNEENVGMNGKWKKNRISLWNVWILYIFFSTISSWCHSICIGAIVIGFSWHTHTLSKCMHFHFFLHDTQCFI